MTLRVEIFTADPDRSARFYVKVLGFREELRHTSGDGKLYVAVGRGSVRIGIGQAWSPVDPEARHVPAGTEIVLEVDDLDAELANVRASGWPLDSDKTRQDWGLTDFRLHDPDGYYLRVSSRS